MVPRVVARDTIEASLPVPQPALPVYFLRVETEMLRGAEVLDRLIDDLCSRVSGEKPLPTSQWVATA